MTVSAGISVEGEFSVFWWRRSLIQSILLHRLLAFGPEKKQRATVREKKFNKHTLIRWNPLSSSFFFLSPLKSKATLCEPDRSSGSSWHFQKKDFIKVIWRWYKKKFIQICKNMTMRYWLIVRLNSCDYPIYPSIDLSRTFKSWTRHLVIW